MQIMVISKNSRAQMKIQQMAFMLVAVMVFFALVGLIIVSLRTSSLKEQASTLAEEKARFLVSKLANSPEFSCGEAFGIGRVSCVDFDKMMLLKDDAEKYREFWGVSNIEIIKIYPKSQSECTFQNYPDCGKITLLQGSGISTENFVSICRKEADIQGNTYDKCELAKLLVSYKVIE